jgi:lipoyl(octanoyl) transferase
MKHRVVFRDLGLIDYKIAWELQEKLFAEASALKLAARSTDGDHIVPANNLLFCEHPHVYTLGKSGSEKNLLISENKLKQKKVKLFRIDRGGDITYHGPGQVVGYPIIDLEQFGMSLKTYVFNVEEAIIKTLRFFDIDSGRLYGASGVWIDSENKSARKICAIGIRASRYITMHGFALNVNTELDYFDYINPCGFTDKSVTSMQKETGKVCDMLMVKNKVRENLATQFDMELLFS